MACGWQYKAKFSWSITPPISPVAAARWFQKSLTSLDFSAAGVRCLSAREEETSLSQASRRILCPPNV
jgi:hypothetical protein